MHLAQVMEEKTDLEKDTFGKMNFTQIRENYQDADMISNLLKIFTTELNDPKELLNQCI